MMVIQQVRACYFIAAFGCAVASMLGPAIGPITASSQEYGATAFQNSGDEAAQDSFLEGVLMLHSFEYEDAREAFQQAQRIDPDFAMAYWGEAMTYNHPVWFSQDREAAAAALEKLGSTAEERLSRAGTSREADYLSAAHVLFGDGGKEERDDAFADEMARLASTYPDDLDAAAFHALSILGTSHEGRDFATYMRAAAIAEEVFDKNPRHPGAAHYLIHSYDDPLHAPLGLRAARVYADIAPSAAHAQHMPSHIFVALGMWDDVVRSNEAAWAASEQRVAEKNLGVNDRGFHALLWLTYGYLQQGRYSDADELIQTMIESHRSANSGRTAYHLAAMRAAYVVETEEWESNAAAAEVDPSMLSTEAGAIELFTRGFVALGRGEVEEAGEELRALRALDGFDDDDHSSAKARAMAHQLDALVTLAQGGSEVDALESLRQAAAMEDTIPIDYGPPSPVKPSYELLGDVLMLAGNPEDADAAYRRALELAPRRARLLDGISRTAAALGMSEESAEVADELANVRKNADARARSRNSRTRN